MENIRCKKGSRHHSLGPFQAYEPIQIIFIGVHFKTRTVKSPPDVKTAAMGNGLKQGRFSGSVFADKECYGSVQGNLFGFLINSELKSMDKVIQSNDKPKTAIMGGAKVSDKIPLIENNY